MGYVGYVGYSLSIREKWRIRINIVGGIEQSHQTHVTHEYSHCIRSGDALLDQHPRTRTHSVVTKPRLQELVSGRVYQTKNHSQRLYKALATADLVPKGRHLTFDSCIRNDSTFTLAQIRLRLSYLRIHGSLFRFSPLRMRTAQFSSSWEISNRLFFDTLGPP
jgi:hypothetical protein